MKKQQNKGWKIVGYVFIILFVFVFLFARIVRPLYRFRHSSILIQDKKPQVINQTETYFITAF